MTLEVQLYQRTQDPIAGQRGSLDLATLVEAKLLGSSADGILNQNRLCPGPRRFRPNPGSAPMELGTTILRRKRLEPAEFDRRRTVAFCFECGNTSTHQMDPCFWENCSDFLRWDRRASKGPGVEEGASRGGAYNRVPGRRGPSPIGIPGPVGHNIRAPGG
jgi:hypothetical protein